MDHSKPNEDAMKPVHSPVPIRLASALDHHAIVAESGARLALGRLQLCWQILDPGNDMHALAAATGRWLQQYRKADGLRRTRQCVEALVLALIALQHRHASCGHAGAGLRLVTHGQDGFGRRPDEGDALGRAGPGELGILGQEAITGMDGIGTAGLGSGDQLVRGVVRLYTTGNLSLAAAAAFGAQARHFDRQSDLIAELQRELHAGVCCLVKGSRSSAMDKVVAALLGTEGEPHAA